MILHLMTDAQAREHCGTDEQWEPDDAVDHGATDVPAPVLRVLADLGEVLPSDSVVRVMRDWEGCLVAVVDLAGAEHLGIYGVLALTSDGRVGEGGVNLPRYFDSLAQMLAHDLHRAHDRLRAMDAK
jgi:hypothetical protein